LTAGGTDWVSSVINQLRLDLSNTSGGAFDVDWIAVGRVAPGASSRALESVTSTVTQQGATLNAESQRIEGLLTSVGAANAAIQNEATARSDAVTALSQQIQSTQSSLGATNASVQQISTAQTGLNNRVNAQFSIKVAVTQSGVYALGGIGVGIQNQNGVLQSVVAVLADQFAVINAAGNGYVSPFAIQGGQVFMNDAFIRDGSIINAKIANGSITSAKIGEAEVDTLRIRGNAVTVPVAYFTSEGTAGAGAGNWIDLVAVYITLDQPGMIQVQFSCSQEYNGSPNLSRFELYVEGTLVSAAGGAAVSVSPVLVGALAVGAGTFKVKARWWAESGNIVVTNKSISALGCKR
ncbi:phage tail tip fiber protein, partial [Pseudomonas juntendi]|uniref:phage tail tip fiber protein n=1 Tax=Pseudomonas juntendi TaxID=2666183 RepID=UPI001F189F9F